MSSPRPNVADPELQSALTALAGVGVTIVVASHQRSGTHLTMDLMRRQFRPCRPRMRPLESIHDTYLSLDRFEPDAHRPVTLRRALTILNKAQRPTIKTHAVPSLESIRIDRRPFARAILDRSDLVYCVRDGRRVMCSLFAWLRSFRSDFDVPFGEFLRQRDAAGLSRPAAWGAHVTAWTSLGPKVTVVKFEDTIGDPEGVTMRLSRKLRLKPLMVRPLIPKPITSPTQSHMARVLGKHTSTNIHSGSIKTPRTEEVFTDADNDFFRREAGEVMDRLGYTI